LLFLKLLFLTLLFFICLSYSYRANQLLAQQHHYYTVQRQVRAKRQAVQRRQRLHYVATAVRVQHQWKVAAARLKESKAALRHDRHAEDGLNMAHDALMVQQIKAEYDSTTSKDTYSTALHYNTKEQQTLQNQFTVDLMEMKRRNDEWLARTQELTTVRARMPHWWWYEREVQVEEARYSSSASAASAASGGGGMPVNFERKTPSLSNGNVTVNEDDRMNHTAVVLATAMKSAGIEKGCLTSTTRRT